jgi:hypothetical protein
MSDVNRQVAESLVYNQDVIDVHSYYTTCTQASPSAMPKRGRFVSVDAFGFTRWTLGPSHVNAAPVFTCRLGEYVPCDQQH